MAVSAIRSVSIPSWINEKNVLAAFSGLYINGMWESLIKYDNNVNQKPISTVSDASWMTIVVSYNLFTSFSRIESTLSSERVTPYAMGYFPNPRGPHFYVALLFTVLNAAKIFKEFKANQRLPSEECEFEEYEEAELEEYEADSMPSEAPAHVPTGMDKFVVVVWKATPYLMIITNIAVTIFQLHQGDSSAWIQLALTGITLIDITSWTPVEYRRYLNTILGHPINAAALYYGNAGIRLGIIFSYAYRLEVVQRKIQEIQAKLLADLQSYNDNAEEN